ncbi:MAG: DUF4097 family beta strand repeat-containing protein [Bryobacteraceae bacterium]
MKTRLSLACLLLVVAATAQAQRSIVIPGTEGSRPPRPISIRTLNGSITVKIHAAKDVVVETEESRDSRESRDRNGMRRIDLPRGLTIDQAGDTIRIDSGPMHGSLTVTVPVETSLTLKALNGPITVAGVQGEIDADSHQGRIQLTNVSGTVVAHTLNGVIQATMDRVAQDKPTYFSTLNGSIDVTLPADLKARVKFDTLNGSIFSDFDITLAPGARIGMGASHGSLRNGRGLEGSINGGGELITFYTLNGTIHLRKK